LKFSTSNSNLASKYSAIPVRAAARENSSTVGRLWRIFSGARRWCCQVLRDRVSTIGKMIRADLTRLLSPLRTVNRLEDTGCFATSDWFPDRIAQVLAILDRRPCCAKVIGCSSAVGRFAVLMRAPAMSRDGGQTKIGDAGCQE